MCFEVLYAEQPEVPSADRLVVGLVQSAPVWLDRQATLGKVCRLVEQAGGLGCQLVVFGEALVPGYPFWLETTGGARFNDTLQKSLYASYLEQGVDIAAGHLDPVCEVARRHGVAVYLGVVERAADRGGHSLYATLVCISAGGVIASTHRKLQPTYEERLVWAPGDGHGLVVHELERFRVGGLNCWENWMPMARMALYGQGEDLHVSVWPGSLRNTADIAQFIARECRGYVIAVSNLFRAGDIPADFVAREQMLEAASVPILANGGSTVVSPDGTFLVPPQVDTEVLIVATLNHARVREERQNFDLAGHYSRPDVLQLSVDRQRQSSVKLLNPGGTPA